MSDTVVLFALPIRPGHEDQVVRFAHSLSADPATRDALVEEGITIESVFIDQSSEPASLWVYQRLPDVERAREVLMTSTNPVNVEMRRLMASALDAPVIIPLAFDYAQTERHMSTDTKLGSTT
jgi:hypothetical protein